jgi:hypothetical protein
MDTLHNGEVNRKVPAFEAISSTLVRDSSEDLDGLARLRFTKANEQSIRFWRMRSEHCTLFHK